jgi:Flp pilus assembly protein TadD
MMSILRVVVAMLVAGLAGGDCLACTMVMLAKGEVVLASAQSAVDWYSSPARIAQIRSGVIKQENVAAAIKSYHVWKNEFRKLYKVDVSEDEINTLGYLLLHDEQISDAIEIFKLNVSEHPTSANTYDSLGEAYMMNGDNELAIANYRLSLELNPENQNARQQLKKLNQDL